MRLVVPAVDIKDGRCVQLVGGDPSRVALSLPDPVEVALDWERRGAKLLHVVDLDGAIEGIRKNEWVIDELIERLRIPFQFGGGIRSLSEARRLLEKGVPRIILGTLALDDPSSVGILIDDYGEDRVMIALDFRRGEVLKEGWRRSSGRRVEDLLDSFLEMGARYFLLTNVDVEGRMSGTDLESFERIMKGRRARFFLSGGFSSLEEIRRAFEIGATGVVIGTALYTGRIQFEEAIGIAEDLDDRG